MIAEVFLVLFLLSLWNQLEATTPSFVEVGCSEIQITAFIHPDASSHKSLRLINDTLYIGGTEALFRQDPANISRSVYPRTSWPASPDQKSNCRHLPQSHSGERCFNYIRTIIPFNDTHMFLCGSMALTAQNSLFNIKTGTVSTSNVPSTALCSYRPSELSIALVGVNDGATSSIAAVSRFRPQISPSIVKNLPDLSTITSKYGKGGMIDLNPEFVSSFRAFDPTSGQLMDKLYFVFGETVQESSLVDRESFGSRIAQVCANDIGGSRSPSLWTSFLKAPLRCQTNEDNPFVFSQVTHSVLSDDHVLYATFTTLSSQFRKSAVCAYRLSDIERAFASDSFLGISNSDKYEEKTTDIPVNPSPGQCAYPGLNGNANATSKDFPREFLSFMEKYSLVSTAVLPVQPLKTSSTRSGPILVTDNEFFSQIAIEKVRDVRGQQHTVIFVATKSGKLLKAFSILKDNNVENRELARYDFDGEEITGLLLSNSSNLIYVQTASKVTQISTGNCDVYSQPCDFCDPCRMCVLARDPMCAWSRSTKRCVDIRSSDDLDLVQDVGIRSSGDLDLVQDLQEGNADSCGELTPNTQYLEVPPLNNFVSLGRVVTSSHLTVDWYNYTSEGYRKLNPAGSNTYRINSDKKLEIMRFSQYDVTKYKAEYKINGYIAAILTTSYTNKTFPNPSPADSSLAPNNNSSTTATPSGTISTPQSSASTYYILFGLPRKETRSNTTATSSGKKSSPQISASSFYITVTLLAFLVLLLVCVIIVLKKKRIKKVIFGSPSKKSRDAENADAADFHSMISMNRTNNSNKGKEEETIAGSSLPEEREPLLESVEVLSTPSKASSQKKVAKVTPYSETGATSDHSASKDEDAEMKQQKPKAPLMRGKSFQSKSIVLKLPEHSKNFRPTSMKRGNRPGEWLIALNLPGHFTFDDVDDDDADEGSSVDPPIVANASADDDADVTTDLKSPDDDFASSGDVTSDPLSAGDASRSFYSDTSRADDHDQDDDSDTSTLKPTNHSSASSNTSTPPSSSIRTSDRIPPEEHSGDAASTNSEPYAGGDITPSDPSSLHPDYQGATRRGKESSREKCPSSSGSSASHSSNDQYKTPPGSPTKKS